MHAVRSGKFTKQQGKGIAEGTYKLDLDNVAA